jgi:hypothetical protein
MAHKHEQRAAPGEFVQHAEIVLRNRLQTIPCLVRTFWRGGACLEAASTAHLPDTFVLIFDNASHGCRVTWRTQTRLGVSFR